MDLNQSDVLLLDFWASGCLELDQEEAKQT